MVLTFDHDRKKHRFYLSLFFFLSGFCFASWAARIPTIRDAFGFNEAQLGTVLLTLPVASLTGLPASGWLVAKYETRIPMVTAFFIHAFCLLLIALATATWALVLSLFFFAFSMRIQNIAMNTQSITLQKQYPKKIVGSFHALWSVGGIAGVGLTTLTVSLQTGIVPHLLGVSLLTFGLVYFSIPHLLTNDRTTAGNKLILGKPDPQILLLGMLIFLAAICEGGMFDWSGIYFKEVVNVPVFTSGYLVFMICMAISRFLSDRIIERIGMQRTYLLSSLFIVSGITLAVSWPAFWPAMAGFSLVGFGTASIIPMTFVLAGESKKYSPGMAISIIATYGMIGILIGPPLIGYLAHAFNLKISFLLFALSGALLMPVSFRYFQRFSR